MIRIATEHDAEAIAGIYAPYVRDTAISFELEPPDLAEMAARIRATLATHPWLVYEERGNIVGYAYASVHRPRPAYRWHADVSVYLNSTAHRRGIGRALYTTLLELLVRQGYFTAYAGITLPNAASVGLHEAMGFTLVAAFPKEGNKFGIWHDVGWWQLPLRNFDRPDAEPVPFAELREAPGFQLAP